MRRARGYGGGSISFNAKTGRYVIRVDLPRGADGKRRPITKYAKTDVEAERVLRGLILKLHRGQVVSTTSPTLAAYLETWFATYQDEWRHSTRRGYRNAINLHIVPALGARKLDALTKMDVQRWLSDAKAEHGARRRVTLAHSVLRSALAGAVRLNLVPFNAADKLKVPNPKKRAVRFLTLDQGKTFLQAAEAHHLSALFTVALSCGLRLGEACGLRWADVDLTTGRIEIRVQLQRVAKGRLELQPVKTAKSERALILPTFAVEALKAHRKQQLADRLKAGQNWVESGLVFTSYVARGTRYKAGAPLQPRNVSRLLDAILVKAGLPRAVTFHGLRHSAASLLLAQGVDLTQISQLLGHSEIRVTADLYGHLVEQTAARAAAIMEGILR